jgi:hypothetical protein
MVFLLSCSHLHRPKANDLAQPQPVQVQEIKSFHQINIVGIMNVLLHTHSATPGVKITGDSEDVARVSWTIRNNVLYVELCKGYIPKNPILVEINTTYLTALNYKGKGSITGNNINTNALDLVLNNVGDTNLNGNIGLRSLAATGAGKITIRGIKTYFLNVKLAGKVHLDIKGVVNIGSCEMQDSSWFSLYWVKSRYLKVRNRGASFLQLAGIAHTVDIELWDNAQFKGKYLRGYRSFVKTHNNSKADIAVVHSQHTLAKDASNIYFYNLATMKANFMADDGSVLDMREWDRPLYQEPTPYNL